VPAEIETAATSIASSYTPPGGVYDDAMLVATPICDDSGGREQLEWTDRVDGCGCCTAAAANTGAVPGVVHHLQPIDLRANRPSARR